MMDIQTIIALLIVAAAVVLAVVLVWRRVGGKDCGCGCGKDCQCNTCPDRKNDSPNSPCNSCGKNKN
ncbi:MAG: hypothetical protein IJQ89_10630 [Bacteroidales bacterium]|nr:hypothetical protein [Bacteroidales bacterium]